MLAMQTLNLIQNPEMDILTPLHFTDGKIEERRVKQLAQEALRVVWLRIPSLAGSFPVFPKLLLLSEDLPWALSFATAFLYCETKTLSFH